MAKMPLAMVSSPRVGPTFSSWSGVGSRLAGRLPERSTLIRCSTSFGLKPCGPPSMMPDSRISELIDRRRHDQVVEQDRQLILEGVPLLGQVLAGELAEPHCALAVELEADRRLEPLVEVGPDLPQVLARDFLALPFLVAEDPGLGPAGRDLLLADDGVLGAGIVGVAPPDAAGVMLDRVRLDRLELRGPLQDQPVGRIPDDPDEVRGLLAGGVLARQRDVLPGIEVLLPVLLRIHELVPLTVGLFPVEISPNRARLYRVRRSASSRRAPGPEGRHPRHACVGEDAESQRPQVDQHLLDFLDLLVARLRGG